METPKNENEETTQQEWQTVTSDPAADLDSQMEGAYSSHSRLLQLDPLSSPSRLVNRRPSSWNLSYRGPSPPI